MSDYFKGWRRNTALAFLLIALCLAMAFAYFQIERALSQRDHQILGPVFILLLFIMVLVPMIGGGMGYRFSQFSTRVARISVGVLYGAAISVACFFAASHLAMEYLAG